MSEPLRIAIDYRPALHARDGIARYARELARALVALPDAPEVVLYASTWKAPAVEPDYPSGARLHVHRRRIPARLQGALLRALHSGADALAGNVDVFHFTQFQTLPLRSAASIATIHDCIYLTRPEFLPAPITQQMVEAARRLVDTSERIVVPTQHVASDVERLLGVARDRIAVTPLGCDHVARWATAPRASATETPYVLTVSRVDERKNHATMLRAFERLVRAGLPHRWRVIGAPGYRAEDFAAALERSPARERVDWSRDVDDARMSAELRNAAAFWFVSRDEGFGIPPLEALACGVPVVAARAGSLPEVLGDAAVLVDPDDDEALFEATRAIALDPSRAAELGARGRARASLYTWRRCAELTSSVYRAAASRRR